MKAAHTVNDHNDRPFGSLFASICENAVWKKRLGESSIGQAVEAVLRDIAVTLTEANLAGAYYSLFALFLPALVDLPSQSQAEFTFKTAQNTTQWINKTNLLGQQLERLRIVLLLYDIKQLWIERIIDNGRT